MVDKAGTSGEHGIWLIQAVQPNHRHAASPTSINTTDHVPAEVVLYQSLGFN
jgi:hypothetical protein